MTEFERLRAQNKALRTALETCATMFEKYVMLHAVKLEGAQPPGAIREIQRKVARNTEMADLCRTAIRENQP